MKQQIQMIITRYTGEINNKLLLKQIYMFTRKCITPTTAHLWETARQKSDSNVINKYNKKKSPFLSHYTVGVGAFYDWDLIRSSHIVKPVMIFIVTEERKTSSPFFTPVVLAWLCRIPQNPDDTPLRKTVAASGPFSNDEPKREQHVVYLFIFRIHPLYCRLIRHYYVPHSQSNLRLLIGNTECPAAQQH